MLDQVRIVLLTKACHKDKFDCGNQEPNAYLQQYASQNQKGNLGRTFVAIMNDDVVRGFYTLAAADIEVDALPAAFAKKLPKYPIPAMLLARLGVDQSCQGKGIGGKLLVDALNRILSASQQFGITVVLVDAKDDRAKAFYSHFGFIELTEDKNRMFLPIETIGQAAFSKQADTPRTVQG